MKDILIDDVIKTGVTKILSNVLKASTLKLLCEHTAVDLTSYREERKPKKDTDSDEKPPSYFPPKSTLARILVDVVNEAGPEAFFKSFEIDTLIFVCHDIDDLSDYIVKKENKEYDFKKLKDKYAKKDFISAIMTNIHTFGLNHLFSLLNVDELLNLCTECRLNVNSRSRDTIIDCLIEQKDFEPEEKSDEGEASEKKTR